MPFTLDQVLGRAVRKQLVGLVRHHAGTFPGETLVDLHSHEGFLARGLAEAMPRSRVLSGDGLEDAGANLEAVALELPKLPFDDASVAAVVGAWLDEVCPWSSTLSAEIERVLVPKGRMLLLGRGPSSRAPGFQRTLPEALAGDLLAAGLSGVAERRLMHLLDGTEALLVEATHGW